MRGLEGKSVLVTGAASGIGRAIAARFAKEGAKVAINYVGDATAAEETLELARAAREGAQESEGAGRQTSQQMIVHGDVSREGDVQAMFRTVIDELGSLDVLVNNAGIQKPCSSDQLELADFDRVLAVNLRGTFLCCREALRHFLTRGSGVILNNSSVHQEIPKPTYLSYSMSKGAMGNLTRTLALEYAGSGIRVNAVGPGAVETPINQAWVDNPEKRALVESHIPMGRVASPEEIEGVFAFLASDDASYITGQTLFVCGGLTLFPEFRTAWASGG